jgi:hypothetical protein
MNFIDESKSWLLIQSTLGKAEAANHSSREMNITTEMRRDLQKAEVYIGLSK